MRVGTLIRHRTQDKEIRLSGNLVLTKDEWTQRGGVYHDSLGNAAKEGWYTVRNCELMGLPITDEEFKNCKDFAMYKDCYAENLWLTESKECLAFRCFLGIRKKFGCDSVEGSPTDSGANLAIVRRSTLPSIW